MTNRTICFVISELKDAHSINYIILNNYRVGHKNCTIFALQQLCLLSTNFHNFCGKFATGRYIVRPSDTVCVTTLPCKILTKLLRWKMVNPVPACLARVRLGAFTSVGWQVTLCDPIWQVTRRSCEMGFP